MVVRYPFRAHPSEGCVFFFRIGPVKGCTMTVTFPDGSTKEYAEDATFMDVAKSISEGFARKVIAAQIDGALYDMTRKVPGNAAVKFLTFDDAAGRSIFWHSTAHVMAAAVKRLFPAARVAIGPAIDEGFYYDFDMTRPFSEEDIGKIEIEMKKIVDEGLRFKRTETARDDAIAFFSRESEHYKEELASELTDCQVTLYKVGDFTDLCRGPHIPDTGMIKAFKLLSVAGAYWRGSKEARSPYARRQAGPFQRG